MSFVYELQSFCPIYLTWEMLDGDTHLSPSSIYNKIIIFLLKSKLRCDIKAYFLIKNYYFIIKGSQGTDDRPLCSKTHLTYYIGATQLNSTSAFFVLSDKIIAGSIDAHANMTRCLWKSSIKSVYAREREREREREESFSTVKVNAK
jgi:hypothetical protein